MEKQKRFSKERWLVSALADRDNGILTDKEIADARSIWVDALDGKTVDEIKAQGNMGIVEREEWFVRK